MDVRVTNEGAKKDHKEGDIMRKRALVVLALMLCAGVAGEVQALLNCNSRAASWCSP
jgi:hypothetical protein